jgi:hypothetical protein
MCLIDKQPCYFYNNNRKMKLETLILNMNFINPSCC